jgi:hypothetical protein
MDLSQRPLVKKTEIFIEELLSSWLDLLMEIEPPSSPINTQRESGPNAEPSSGPIKLFDIQKAQNKRKKSQKLR